MNGQKSLLQELMDLHQLNPEAAKRRMERLTGPELMELSRENFRYSRQELTLATTEPARRD